MIELLRLEQQLKRIINGFEVDWASERVFAERQTAPNYGYLFEVSADRKRIVRCAHISAIGGTSDNPDGDAERLEKDARQAVEEFLGCEREGKKGHSQAMPQKTSLAAYAGLPTAHEQGLTDFDVVTWNAFSLPKGAPKEIVKKFNDATSQAMDTPAIKNRMHELGITGVALERRSSEYLANFVVDEIARWEGPIKANGLQVD